MSSPQPTVPRLMGVVNVTPDSFSDGGDHASPDAAIAHARELIAQGADIIDIGGESTRPGSTRITPAEELARIRDVVAALVNETVVSVDTIHAATAREAIAAGCHIINDVSGGLHDPEMLATVAASSVDYVIQHWRGIPDPAHSRSHYDDVVADVVTHLRERASAAEAAGITAERIILDPGLGFDKTSEQGWELLRRLPELTGLGYRVLVGASRKRMLKDLLDTVPGAANAPKDRDLATAMVTLLCADTEVWAVRVHDVSSSAQALAVHHAWHGSGARTVHPHSEPGVITVTGLRVHAHHGVFASERETGQTFLIDARLETDTRTPGRSDSLADTVNYAEVIDALAAVATRDPVDLIETLAERLLDVVFDYPGVTAATVTVHKPDAPVTHEVADIAVTATRRRP